MLNIFICFLLIELALFSIGSSLIFVQWAIMRIWNVDEFTGQIWRIWEFLEKLFLTLGFLFISPTILLGIINLFKVLI